MLLSDGVANWKAGQVKAELQRRKDGFYDVRYFYGDHSLQVADVSYGDRNAAVVSLAGDNVDVVRAAQELRRRGSP